MREVRSRLAAQGASRRRSHPRSDRSRGAHDSCVHAARRRPRRREGPPQRGRQRRVEPEPPLERRRPRHRLGLCRRGPDPEALEGARPRSGQSDSQAHLSHHDHPGARDHSRRRDRHDENQAVRQQIDEVLDGINGSDEAARSAALEALRYHQVAPEPTEEELLAGTPLREVPEATVEKPGDEVEAKPQSRRAPKNAPARDESLLEDDPSGTDVVNEIFARLRKATLEERGVTIPPPKKVAAAKPETPVGVLFRRRDAALEDSLSVLTRRVKRALQDDQNIMLERLRNVQAMITTELEDEHTQRARYADAHDSRQSDSIRAANWSGIDRCAPWPALWSSRL